MYSRLRGDRYWVPVAMDEDAGAINIRFGFNRPLLNEIKAMAGARWHPEEKYWSVKDCERNRFQLAFLAGEDPYAWYDRPLIQASFDRSLYTHQRDMVRHCLTYRHVLLAVDPGLGKSLAAIEVMERSGHSDWIYVAPRSAIASFQIQLQEWKSQVTPTILTYEGLQKLLGCWPEGKRAPFGVIFDESSRIKSPTAQRSQAAYHLAQSIRRERGRESYIILMSGTPAPKSPLDYWWQCEVACPGFLKEGTIEKFKARLGLIAEQPSLSGASFRRLVTWFDDPRKCATCGQFAEVGDHDPEGALFGRDYHPFQESKDEVSYLYERMKGLVLVRLKKDCLAELPDKRYRVIRCKPDRDTLAAARLAVAGASTVIEGITLVQELSDGFRYVANESGREPCPTCSGSGTVRYPTPILDQDAIDREVAVLAAKAGVDPATMPVPDHLLLASDYEEEEGACSHCGGSGDLARYTRGVERIACPKDDVIRDLLDVHDEDGRLVVYGRFTATIDRIVEICTQMNWEWIKADGRGWKCSPSLGLATPVEMVCAFQGDREAHPRLCFVGQPTAAGMGLTLTASYEAVFYSNDDNAESRMQAIERIHRIGMDLNKGALITDISHLPTDDVILENHERKKRLQDLTLGVLQDALKED